jgi:hypothetical protein
MTRMSAKRSGTQYTYERFWPWEETQKNMSFKYIAIAATLALAPAAFAQNAGNAEPQIKPNEAGPAAAGETSDRSPHKAAKTPQAQQDTAGGKTSDRSQNKDVKVEHQPGAAGTAGSESSEGSSVGTSGSNTSGSKTTKTAAPTCLRWRVPGSVRRKPF